MVGQPLDYSSSDLLPIRAAVPEDPVVLGGWHVRRMGHDPIERLVFDRLI
jgi:hypothetical protein